MQVGGPWDFRGPQVASERGLGVQFPEEVTHGNRQLPLSILRDIHQCPWYTLQDPILI